MRIICSRREEGDNCRYIFYHKIYMECMRFKIILNMGSSKSKIVNDNPEVVVYNVNVFYDDYLMISILAIYIILISTSFILTKIKLYENQCFVYQDAFYESEEISIYEIPMEQSKFECSVLKTNDLFSHNIRPLCRDIVHTGLRRDNFEFICGDIDILYLPTSWKYSPPETWPVSLRYIRMCDVTLDLSDASYFIDESKLLYPFDNGIIQLRSWMSHWIDNNCTGFRITNTLFDNE